MERKLMDGDYVPDGAGGLTVLTGAEEVLQRVLFRLTARRGALPFLPGLGSRLYLLPREKPSARQALAAQYAAEALEDEEGVTVTGAQVQQETDGLAVQVFLDWQGTAMTAGLVMGEGTDENG